MSSMAACAPAGSAYSAPMSSCAFFAMTPSAAMAALQAASPPLHAESTILNPARSLLSVSRYSRTRALGSGGGVRAADTVGSGGVGVADGDGERRDTPA